MVIETKHKPGDIVTVKKANNIESIEEIDSILISVINNLVEIRYTTKTDLMVNESQILK